MRESPSNTHDPRRFGQKIGSSAHSHRDWSDCAGCENRVVRFDPTAPHEDADDACCRVCGRQTALTFEHLPPKGAGNRERAEMLGVDAWLRRSDNGEFERGTVVQRGSGAYTLCDRCNTRAGALYVPERIEWTERANVGLANMTPPVPEIDGQLEPGYATAKFKHVQPVRFLKQIVTMLLALSPGGFPPRNLDLMAFAQDPEWVGLPNEYQFYLALYCGPLARYNGGAGVLQFDPEKGWGTTYTMELSYPPFSYVLSHDEATPAIETGNITGFADLDIHQTADVEIQMRVGFGHTIFPLDYRTKAALEADRAQNEAVEARTP